MPALLRGCDHGGVTRVEEDRPVRVVERLLVFDRGGLGDRVRVVEHEADVAQPTTHVSEQMVG
jgi:hypothetical protein